LTFRRRVETCIASVMVSGSPSGLTSKDVALAHAIDALLA
jgi:hypothetical protein